MKKISVIAIFDVGKTNKKLLLFDEQLKIVYEENVQLKETEDEDNFPCEDVDALTLWLKNSFARVAGNERFEIVALNFSGYGASFVYLDENGNVCAPLYNYLKPYPKELSREFYDKYGGEQLFSKLTSSPVLGSLNSGMQLYRLKYENPELFKKIKYALHLPQYLSYVFTGKISTDITSIGCHTNLWNFGKNKYHDWVQKENVEEKFTPIFSSSTTTTFDYNNKKISAGFGLHDSSAALIPYMNETSGPFILLSTGTWCIALNPFNNSPLTDQELKQDCLCYLSFKGKPVKASRLFLGNEHEEKIKQLSVQFNKPINYYQYLFFNQDFLKKNDDDETYEKAYHFFIKEIVAKQVKSINLVLTDEVKKIFIEGGFCKNDIYLKLLAHFFPGIEICRAETGYASALGAALIIKDVFRIK